MHEQLPPDRELTPEEQAIEASLLTSQGEATLFALEQFHQSKQALFELVDQAMRGEVAGSPDTAISVAERIETVAFDYAAAVLTEENPGERARFSAELFYGSALQIKGLFLKYETPETIFIDDVDEITKTISDNLHGAGLAEVSFQLQGLLKSAYTETLHRLLQYAR